MADKVIFVASAFKHGCTQADIERVIETQIYEGPLEGEDDIYAIIGFDSAANPIEIFYNSVDEIELTRKRLRCFMLWGAGTKCLVRWILR